MTTGRVTLVLALCWLAGQQSHAGTLASVAPTGASVLVPINITSTAFDPTAGNNEVTFLPAAGGSVTTVGTRIATLDSTSGLRRLTVTVPAPLPIGPTALRVRNTVTGEISEGQSIDVIAIALPDVAAAARGASNVVVRVSGTFNVRFVAGGTRAAFGSGVTVHSITVQSPTQLVATISIASTAALGPRAVGVLTGQQTATLPGGFTVTEVGTPSNAVPVAHPGGPYTGTAGEPVQFDGSASSDPDAGDTIASYSWSFGDGNTATGATPTHVFAAPGTYTASLTVRDSTGAEHTATVSVTIAAANQPPVARPGGPYTGTVGQPIVFDGSASSDSDSGDTLASYAWAFSDGGTATGPTPTYVFTTAGDHTASLTVRDSRGLESTAAVAVTIAPANQPPVSRPGGPYTGTAGEPIAFDGSASSDADSGDTIVSYAWTFGDGNTGTGPTPTHVYTAAGSYTVSLTVRDSHGVESAATAGVSVAAANQSPVAHPGGPYAGTAGEPITFDATGSVDGDGDQLTYEWAFGDGATASGAMVTHAYATPGTFTSALTVTDGRGGSHTATFDVQVAPAPLGRGVVTGRVVDDATGLPVAGATARLLDEDGSPADTLPVTSDHLGRYRLSADVGSVRVLVTKDGFTSTDLAATVAEGRRTEPDDARLTVLAAETLVSAVAGGTVTTRSGTRLEVAPGALLEDRTLRVTDVTPQGPTRRLPLGWTPLAVVDVSGGSEFGGSATLAVRVGAQALAGRMVTLGRWNHGDAAWIAAAVATASSDGSMLEATIPGPGQYAFAVEDLPPGNPPQPSIGAPLAGVAPRAPPSVQLALSPSPRVLFAQPGVRATVTAIATPSEPLPSGTPLLVDLTETFAYTSGSTLTPRPQRRRLALYRSDANALNSTFVVAPSRPLAAFTLHEGAIDLTGRVPADPSAPRGRVFGSSGGEFTTTTGERVLVPPGASAEDVPVDLTPLAAEFPLDIPSGSILVAGVDLDLHGASLSRDLVLAVTGSAPLPSGSTVAVVQLVDIGEATRMALVAVATETAGSLVTTVDPFGDGSVILPGVRSEGRYAFIRLDGARGYLTGLVTSGGTPIGGALVESGDFPIAAVSDANGRYVLLAAAGEHTLRVTNPSNGDSTAVQVTATGGVTDRAVPLGPSPPAVVGIVPANGASNVPLGSGVRITFSEPVDPATLTNAVVLAANGATVSGSVSVAPDTAALTFLPAELLQSDTEYRISVAATVRDLAGHAMASAFAASFRTVDLTPPPTPAPGSVLATIPDASGSSVISGSSGTADPGGVVLVRNLRTNALTTLTPDADGSFSGVVSALRSDHLEITIRDAAGNETGVPVPPFRGADGSVVVGAAGGRVEGAGGVAAEIPPGALPDGTIVRIAAVPESALGGAIPTDYSFAAGVHLDLGGVRAQREITLSVPAAGQTGQHQIVVARPVAFRGQQWWTVIERAALVEGEYRTQSPPFPGVHDTGTFAFLRPVGDCLSYVAITFRFDAELALLSFPFIFGGLEEFRQTVFPAFCGAQLEVQVADAVTGEVLDSIAYAAPAAADDILFSSDVLTDDFSPPEVLSINNPTGQEVNELHIRFNKPLNAGSIAAHFVVKDSHGNDVVGSTELADSNTRLVFRPDVPFQLGQRYTVILAGVADEAGNLAATQPISFTPYAPRVLSALTQDSALAAALQKCSAAGCTSSAPDVAFIGHTLFVANGVRRSDEQYSDPADPRRLLAVDVSDPFRPALIGWHATTTNPRALAAVADVNLVVGAELFTGDLLIVAGGGRVPGGELDGKTEVWDVSACTARPLPEPALGFNCLDGGLRGFKLLSTAAGTPPRPNVPPDAGVPLQVAVMHQRALLPQGDTLLAYFVTPPVGLEVVDVRGAFNLPNPNTSLLGPDGLLRGDFSDVAILKNRVVTVGRSLEHQIQVRVLTAQLGHLADFPEPPAPLLPPKNAARVGIGENVVFDLDGDGRVGRAEEEDDDDRAGVDEIFDLAIVASGGLTDGCVQVVPCGELYIYDLSAHTHLAHGPPRYLGSIPLPGSPFSVQVDSSGRRAYVELRGRGIAIVDLSFLLRVLREHTTATPFVDADDDGRDDRVLAIVPLAGNQQDVVLARIKVDIDRGVAYVNGGTTGVQAIQIANRANELALDFGAGSQVKEADLRREKGILKRILDAAIAAVRAALPAAAPVSALEQGSGSCFWREPFDTAPERTCPAFHPGVSDHDVEVLVAAEHVAVAQRALNLFVESDAAEEMGIKELGDLSLYAMPREAFEAAELPVGTPLYGEGVSDATGDLGLGRQLLMLLWILEGEYVEGHQGGLPPLDALLEVLRDKPDVNPVIPPMDPPPFPNADEPSGIPRLEGHEWSLVQEFNAYKTGALLRVSGACNAEDPRIVELRDGTAFELGNDPVLNVTEQGFLGQSCRDEIHSVAKYAIRSAFARIAADDAGNALILNIDPVGNDHRNAYRRRVDGACVDGDFTAPYSPGAQFTRVPCTGFEHYMLAVAVRTLQQDLGIFSPDELPLIFKFYCLKVGCDGEQGDPIISNDVQADEFLRAALNFISDVKAETESIYVATVRLDTKEIGNIPLLTHGPLPKNPAATPGPGISGICGPLLSSNPDFVAPFLLPDPDNPGVLESIPAEITPTTRRKFLRICNNLIVSRQTNGDPTVQNPAGLGSHVQLDVARAELKRRLGVKNYVDWNLQVRALNLGTRTVEADLRLYEGAGDHADTYEELKRYPPNEDTPGLMLAPGERRVFDVERIPGEDDPAKKRPMFPLLFNVNEPEFANQQLRAIAFVIDPARKIQEANKLDNQAAFFYYVLDLDSTAPAPPVEDPAPAADDVSPDPLAIEQPRMSFTITARRPNTGTFYGGKQISVALYEPIQIRYQFSNLSSKPLRDIQVLRQGQVVATLPSLAPMGQTGDTAVLTDSQLFVPTEAGTHIERRTAVAIDEDSNTVGQLTDSVSITATDAIQLFSVQLFDASPLANPEHPFNRVSTNRDEQQREIPLRGATTDGDPAGSGGGRVRVQITGLLPSQAATIRLEDPEVPGATTGLGWLESGGRVTTQPVEVMADSAGHAVVFYRPPSVFVRDAHREVDARRTERVVGLRIIQTQGSTLRRITLRRPPVFLIHGIFSSRATWSSLQPLVPAAGVGPHFKSFSGFDGRFDIFAVGVSASGTLADDTREVTGQIGLSLKAYLPGFAVGKVDLIGHDAGGLIARAIANSFPTNSPVRKIITIGAPFFGTQLAQRIIDIRSQMPLRFGISAPKDLLDLVSSFTDGEGGAPPQVAPEVKAQAKLETCGFMIQTLGLTPALYTHGAFEELVPGSDTLLQLDAAGIRVPSHHVVVETAVPELGAGIEMELLWGTLGYFCNLTPDAETDNATVLFKTGVQAGLIFLPAKIKALKPTHQWKVRGLDFSVSPTGLSVGKKFPWASVSENFKTVMSRLVPAMKFAQAEESSSPTPVFPAGNDRVVGANSQRGTIPAEGNAYSSLAGFTDHVEALVSGGIPATACDPSASRPPTPEDLNGDDVPDVSCRLIWLLEAAPAAPWFYDTVQP